LLKSENLDLYDLALQMGTSVQMLQKTYSRLTARLRANKIKRKAYKPDRGRQEQSKATTIIETDAEIGNLRSLDLSEPKIKSGSAKSEADEQVKVYSGND
jgi:hypothetical protein